MVAETHPIAHPPKDQEEVVHGVLACHSRHHWQHDGPDETTSDAVSRVGPQPQLHLQPPFRDRVTCLLPDPVAIWMSARGRSTARDFSSSAIARVWAGHRDESSIAGMVRRQPRSVAGPPASPVAWATHLASVSGRWTANTSRLRGSGSRPLVKRVSIPVDSQRNGRGRTGASTWSGPAAYLAYCGSTPMSEAPRFFASSAPTAWRSTKRR